MEENNNNTEEIKEAVPANENELKEENTEKVTENNTEKVEETKKEDVSSEDKKNKTIDTDELKKETANTVNEVKETVKKVDIKKESVATKNFVVDFVKNPLGKIKEIANEPTNKYFITTIFIVVIWAILEGVSTAGSYTHFFKYNFGDHVLSLIKAILAPALGIIVMSVLALLFNKDNKKSLITNINAITAAKIPLFLASIVDLLRLFKLRDTSILTAFSGLCAVISTVLVYFALKELFGEKEDEKFFKKFLLVEAIFYVVYFVISLLKIYMF